MGTKQIIKQVAGKLGYEIRRSKLFDLSVIERLKTKDVQSLSDPRFLETDLLLKLGLNREQMDTMPEELYRFCGHGLYSWQYPNQFSKYLAGLSKFPIESYLEIGVHHGGTFVITVEYLDRFHPIQYAVGLDIGCSPLLLEYEGINPNVLHMLVNSQSTAFQEFMRSNRGFDLVLIDGDHGEDACQSDFEAVRAKTNICVLHDITNDASPGPGRVWNRIKAQYSEEYEFFEYTDQYESVRRRTGKRYLGIGVAARKRWMTTSS